MKHVVVQFHSVNKIALLLFEIFYTKNHAISITVAFPQGNLDWLLIHIGTSPYHPRLVSTFLLPQTTCKSHTASHNCQKGIPAKHAAIGQTHRYHNPRISRANYSKFPLQQG